MRIAIVTGASSGLGREFAKETAARGGIDEIWVIARRKEKLESLAEEISGKVRILPLSLTEEASLKEIEMLLREEKPDIRLFVNNAGRGKAGLFQDEPEEEAAQTVRLDCGAAAALLSLVIPYMKEGSGIINVCSVAGFLPLPGLAVYSASKAFLLSLSRSLSVELKPRHITVTALCPYWVGDTEFMERTGVSGKINTIGLLKTGTVVRKALKANRKGKSLCIPGLMGKLTYFGCSVLPLPVLLFFRSLWKA